MIQQPPSSSPPVPAPTVDPRRPFGAHVRMSWWKPLLIVIVPLLVMIIAQYALMIIAVIVEIVAFGRDPYATAMTPLMMLAGNLSLTLMGPLAILLTAWLAKVPWRSLLSFPRGLSGARWGVYGAAFTGLVVIGLLLTWLSRLTPDGVAHLVVQRHLGSDSLQKWLEAQGHPTERLTSRAGFRVLTVGPAPTV